MHKLEFELEIIFLQNFGKYFILKMSQHRKQLRGTLGTQPELVVLTSANIFLLISPILHLRYSKLNKGHCLK